MVMAILGATVLLTRIGIDFLNNLFRQRSLMQLQQEAQVVMFNIAREVRNAREIKEATFNRLVLSSFNLRNFDPSSVSLFDPVNVGTITYQYTLQGTDTFLEKKEEFPTPAPYLTTKKFMVNLLLTPDTTNYVFKSGPGAFPPFETVDISFRMSPSILRGKVVTFQEKAMKRARTQ